MIRLFASICLTLAAVGYASGAEAQGPAPAEKSLAPVDSGKRYACAADVSARKLRGNDRLDAMQICMAEGRLDCVKRAVAQKVAPSSRKVFIQGCMQGPAFKADKIKR